MAWVSNLWAWAAEHWLWLASALGLTIVMAIASVVLVRYVLLTLPADYFLDRHPQTDRWHHLHPGNRWALFAIRNVAGWALVILGVVMLFTPGQGLLTIALGVLLVDFPGKRTLERRLIFQPAILKYVNHLRAANGKQPLQRPGSEQAVPAANAGSS